MIDIKRNKNFNIPNLITLLRIALIPFFAYFYLVDKIIISTCVIVFSGITDIVDGYIARHFNQITELGKILDPFADKLTQVTLALCLGIKFNFLLPILIIFLAKELTMIVMSSILIKKKKTPGASKWYGKVSTVLFYISVVIIVMMSYSSMDTTDFIVISLSLLGITAVLMVYSAIRYFAIFLEIIHSENSEHKFDLKNEMKSEKNSV